MGLLSSGGVTIAGTSYLPPAAESLPAAFEVMIENKKISDIYDKAIIYF